MSAQRGDWPAPDFSMAAAYPDVARAAQALQAGDWPAARSAWDSLDWVGRDLLVSAACDTERVEVAFFERLAGDFPGDTVVGTFLGAMLINVGWEIRTASRAQDVSADQFKEFHEYLRRAERVLIDVTARDPANATAWSQRQKTARGLELHESEARRRYDRLSRQVPNYQPAQTQLLQKLCPKWGGSWEKVHAFGRECLLGAPEGAINAVIVLEGHLEHWADLSDGEDGTYLRQPSLAEEVREAAQRSIWHPAYRPVHGWARLENAFALMFALLGDHPAALRQFERIGPVAAKPIWSYYDDPADGFVRSRRLAIRNGAGR